MLLLVLVCFLVVIQGRVINNQDKGLLSSVAISSARDNGCLNNYHGLVDTRSRIVSSCFAGGFVQEVLVVPVCEVNCENVRLRPLAKVMFNCGENPSGIECLAD